MTSNVRIVGVLIIDLKPHVKRGLLMTHRPEAWVPEEGYPPGSNIEIHIGDTRRVHPADPTLYDIVRGSRGSTIVVKGNDTDGLREVLRVLDRMSGIVPKPEVRGCEDGCCEILYGNPDLQAA